MLWQKTEQDSGALRLAGECLELILGELSQLVLSFTYCFENDMLPWCNKAPPSISGLGPAFRRVHTLTADFSKASLRKNYRKHVSMLMKHLWHYTAKSKISQFTDFSLSFDLVLTVLLMLCLNQSMVKLTFQYYNKNGWATGSQNR